jgi:hypothetical protein
MSKGKECKNPMRNFFEEHINFLHLGLNIKCLIRQFACKKAFKFDIAKG